MANQAALSSQAFAYRLAMVLLAITLVVGYIPVAYADDASNANDVSVVTSNDVSGNLEAADDSGDSPDSGSGDSPDPGSGDSPDPSSGDSPDPGSGDSPDPGSGDSPDPGSGDSPDPGSGDSPDPGSGDSPDPGSGDSPDPGSGDSPDPGSGDSPDPGSGDSPDPGSGDSPDPGSGDNSGDSPNPGSGGSPDPGNGGNSGDSPDPGTGGNSGESPDSGQSSASSESPNPNDNPGDQTQAYISDVGIYLENSNTCLATRFADYTQVDQRIAKQAVIDKKGGSIKLDHVVYWDNGDQDRNGSNVTWVSQDTSIAVFVGNTGELRARSDGMVKIRAIVDSDRVADGKKLLAEATITIQGQTDDKFVVAIRILDPDGNDVTNGLYQIDDELATAQVQLWAEVVVKDPTTDEVQTMRTKGLLSKEVPELGDLSWRVGDPALGAIMEDSGLFRPSKYAMVAVIVESYSGFGGALVTASTVVATQNPNEEDQGDEYHPQDSLTIKAYYELTPPSEYGDVAYVIDQTYSLGDLMSLGALTACYTAIASGTGFYTMQGTGVPLAAVLRDAGVNLEGVKSFAFTTADWPTGENRPVTYGFVFQDRYYYPNYDLGGSMADAVQVFPILAWSSSQIKDSTNLSVPMTEATRFRLLFGSTPAGGSSQYQIKWINTIYVVLEGAAPEGNGGEGEEGEGSGSHNQDGTGDNSNGSVPPGDGGDSGTSTPSPGNENPAITTTNTIGVNSTESASPTSTDTESVPPAEDLENEATEQAAEDAASQQQGRSGINVYQVMNRNASDTNTDGAIENPFSPYVVPLGAVAVGAGGLEALLWFLSQRREILAVKALG